jgi:hypothetical protein
MLYYFYSLINSLLGNQQQILNIENIFKYKQIECLNDFQL